MRVSVAIAGAVVLLVGGAVLASAMGFTITLPLLGESSPASSSGINLIALPYKPATNIVALATPTVPGHATAGGLLEYINGGECVGKPAHAVQKVDLATDGYISYDGCSGSDFDLIPGEAFYLIMRQPATVRISGVHDPGATIQFLAAGAGSMSGTNYYAPPYHGVSSTAREMFREIGGSVMFLLQHLKLDDTYEVYTYGGGTLPPNGWNISPGEGYVVKVVSTTNFNPRHY